MRSSAPLLQHLFLARVPLLGLVLLIVLAWLGRSGSATLTNMMLMKGWFQLALSVFLATTHAALCGILGLLVWHQAPTRFGVSALPQPRILRHQLFATGLPFGLFALPLAIRLWQRNALDDLNSPDLGLFQSTLAVGGGLAASALLLLAIEEVRRRFLVARLLPRLGRSWLGRVLTRLARLAGPGYYDPGTKMVAPGHTKAFVFALTFLVIYVVAFYGLRPDRGGSGLVPTLAYVLGLAMLVISLLAGLSFFLDRFRFPLILGVVLFAVVMGGLFPRDHYFTVQEVEQAPPAPEAALEERLALQRQLLAPDQEPVLVMVGATGGGIQAAAWTAKVLTELQAALGEEFTRSVYLVSAVSGGSAATFFYLQGFDPATGAVLPELLEPIRDASGDSSLEATAWGLVFPDTLATFVPFIPLVDRRQDRAWALERAWLKIAHRRLHGGGPKAPAPEDEIWLSDWQTAAREGWLPATVLNSTVVENGEQLWFATVDLSGIRAESRQTLGSAPAEHYGADVDLPVVSAARLSATFPYVTPLARGMRPDGTWQDLAGWHVGDGGFFDNFGVVASLEWLLKLYHSTETPGELLEPFRKVVYLQISAFAAPRPEVLSGKEHAGAAFSTIGPVQTILNVRSSSQRSRNGLELQMLEKFLEDRLETFIFQPPQRTGQEKVLPRDPDCNTPLPLEQPVSWFLSETDKLAIHCDWLTEGNQAEKERLGSLLRSP